MESQIGLALFSGFVGAIFAQLYHLANENRKRSQAKKRLLLTLSECLHYNLRTIDEIFENLGIDMLQQFSNPFPQELLPRNFVYPLHRIEVDTLHAVQVTKYDLLDNEAVCRSVDIVKRELQLLSKHLDLILLAFPHSHPSIVNVNPGYWEMIQAARQNMHTRSKEIRDSVTNAILQVERLIIREASLD